MRGIPNFIEGMSRILDLGSTINKKKFEIQKDEVEADREAMLLDWEAVGDDIRGAIDEFECVGAGRRER